MSATSSSVQKLYLKCKDHWSWIVLGSLVIFGLNKFYNLLLEAATDFFQNHKSAMVKGAQVILTSEIKIKIIPVLVAIVGVYIVSLLYKAARLRKRKFKIIEAIYGADSKVVDITNELNNAVAENRLKIVLSNNIAGDPCVGTKKIGKIKYAFNGNVQERQYEENEVIDLPSV